MMDEVSYSLTIKKEYAIPILKQLVLDKAITIYTDEIPEWQKIETLRRIIEIDLDPSKLISSEDFWDSINADD
jgi:hypothetical protein